MASTAPTATASADPLNLTPPDPVPAVAPDKAAGLVPIDEEKKSKLEEKVDAFVDDLVAQDANSPEFGKRVDQLTNMGRKEIAEAAGHSNRFLDRPVRAMDSDTKVGADLAELRRTVEDLDPGKRGSLLAPKKLFGIIPFGNKMRDYFDSYKSAQSHINAILGSLASGKDTLIKDNAAIDVERQNMWQTMGRLEQMIHISKTMDARLEAKAMELDATDPAKAKAIRESALFYIRQRTQDLLTQMAVTVQGYLALDLVKKNNVELVKGVDRASTTTVAALRTAVTVAQALVGQRLVLEQITALNSTTANMIDRTGELLKSQTAQIHEQAASSTIPIETLQRAFQNIYDTMDNIDTFKMKALENMKTTVNTLSNEVEKSKGYIARFLRRHSDRGRSLSARARQRRNASIMRRLGRIAGAAFVILIGAMIAGWFVPLGTNGVMIVLGLLLVATLFFALIPGERAVKPEKLADSALAALPLRTEIWLETQRKALPAPAVTLVDSIGVRLETLAPQLERLNEQEPAAQEIRRLLSDHLPELVTGYQSIPAPMRREERNGRVPEKQLVEGLTVIDAEIARVTESLASGDLDKLATQNRFLELKYQEAKELGR